VFMWLGPLAGFLKFGTDGYPRAVQRRLRIVNAMALLIAVFSVIYAAVFAYYDAEHYRHLIVVNLLLAVIVLLVPLAHRINDIAAAVLIAIVEYVALFFFVRVFGHESGIQINYIIAAAVAFAIYGLSHFRIAVAVIAAGPRYGFQPFRKHENRRYRTSKEAIGTKIKPRPPMTEASLVNA